MKKILFLSLVVSLTAVAQTPPRKALIGLLAKPAANGIVADSILPNSSFAALAIQKGDIITGINGNSINSMESYGKSVSGIRAGERITVVFTRNGKLSQASAIAVMRPYEQSVIADVQYDWVKFRNGYLRAITRKPKGKEKCPAILLIPGYGCGSIENYMSSYNGKLLTEWLKAGYAVITIEKSGLGDSYNCVPCSEVDLATDIESFDAGYTYMEQLPFTDKNKLYIWGHSMGGVIAPEVAKRHNPKGVMVFGTTFRPWSEFLLEMHRVQKPLLDNLNYLQTEDFMRKIQKIYYEFFVLRRTREALLKNPEYRDLVISELGYKEGSNDMWGRHWAFWPQIDSLNLAQSWARGLAQRPDLQQMRVDIERPGCVLDCLAVFLRVVNHFLQLRGIVAAISGVNLMRNRHSPRFFLAADQCAEIAVSQRELIVRDEPADQQGER